MIASEGWSPRAERDLRIAYLFATAKAQRALDARKYAEAEQLANQSLRLRPDQPRAVQVLAAQFAQANFSGAAAAYRKILETGSPIPDIYLLSISYAQALAASDRRSAATEFRRWEEDVTGLKPREIDVAGPGLALLAGDLEVAHRLEIELKQAGDVRAPVWIGELGWWHYLNADHHQAVELLSEARPQRPADINLGLQLAWMLIETRRYGDALQTLESFSYGRQAPPEKAIVQAVAHWQAQEREEAMRDFAIGMGSRAEWENPRWVSALYSPLVGQSIREMQAERERRRQKVIVDANREGERN
jgi:Flp pilus assembly protein TadD